MTCVLLDTSAYSALMRGHREVGEASRVATEVAVTPVVIGELLAGFRRGRHRAANERGLEEFLQSPRARVLAMTEATSERYAAIFNRLRGVGTPIPINDVWIAASAMEHGAVVYTTDTDFDRVTEIVVRRFDPQ